MTETTTTTTTTTPAKTKKSKPLVACWCGCGGTTKSRFVPGHDARFHGSAKKVARNEADAQTAQDALPHDEARAAFAACVEHEIPKAEAKAFSWAFCASRRATAARKKAEAKLAAKTATESKEEATTGTPEAVAA